MSGHPLNFSGAGGGRGDGLGGAAAEPPDDSAEKDENDGNQLRAGHETAEYGAAARIAAQEFEKVPRHAVQDQIGTDDLAIELLALEHPGEHEEVGELHGGFK